MCIEAPFPRSSNSMLTSLLRVGVILVSGPKITLILPSRVRHPVEIVDSMIYKVFVKFSF